MHFSSVKDQAVTANFIKLRILSMRSANPWTEQGSILTNLTIHTSLKLMNAFLENENR